MAIEMTCPTCGSHDISKNGTSHRGKQNYKCRDCGRQFVENPQWQPKPKETKALVNRLLPEKILLAGIARATETSESWVQGQANATYEAVPQTVEIVPKPKGPLKVQIDELWSFVDSKGNKQGVSSGWGRGQRVTEEPRGRGDQSGHWPRPVGGGEDG